MKAAVFERIGENPVVRDWPDPVAEGGEVIVAVAAAPVLAYANEVFSGKRPMLFALPFVPGTGAIGRIAALGPEATELRVGEWVYCDPTLRARDGQGLPAIALQGLTANGPAALPVQRRFPHGSWAERLRLPIENVAPLGDVKEEAAGAWLTLGTMLVPYGGLSSVALRAGETVVVNGATGSFGAAAVAVALAMGAAQVDATGRNADALAALSERFGDRVRPVAMRGVAEDEAAIVAAASAPIDVVFDILPPAGTASQVLSALRTVRPGGRCSLMGGVGMAGGEDLSLPYAWLMRNNITIKGQWLYERDAMSRLISLVRSGVLSFGGYEISEFRIDDLDSAIQHAATASGPFEKTVIRFDQANQPA